MGIAKKGLYVQYVKVCGIFYKTSEVFIYILKSTRIYVFYHYLHDKMRNYKKNKKERLEVINYCVLVFFTSSLTL